MNWKVRRGSTLVLALGVLALLSIMAVTFTTLVRLELASSVNYVNGIKAKFLAESGISYAIAELRRTASARSYTNNSDGAREYWIREDLIGKEIEEIAREKETYEGFLAGTYIAQGDRYRVKVVDCASQINLNTHYGTSRKILARMLDNLAAGIEKKALRNPLSSYKYKGYTGGEALLVFRESELPGRAFTSKSQLIEPLGEENFSVLQDYVAVSSWIDPQTLKGIGTDDPRSPVDFEAEPRAPVNINTATKEVLTACLTGLAGRRVYVLIPPPITQSTERTDTPLPGVNEPISITEPTLTFIYTDPITFRDASVIADRIIEARKIKPFREWQDFYDFADNMSNAGFERFFAVPATVPSTIRTQENFNTWYEKSVRSLLKANFNPNALPNRFNPNKGAFQEIDKFSLFRLEGNKPEPSHTTEFCFGSMGRFEIISLGEIAAPEGIAARSKIRKVVRLCEIVRQTTQAQFEEYVGGKGTVERSDVVTYPEPCSVLGSDYASTLAGYVEIKPRDEGSGPGSQHVFKAGWEGKDDPPGSGRSLWADSPATPYPNPVAPVAMKVGPLMKLKSPYNDYGDLFVDGVNTSIAQTRKLGEANIGHTTPRILLYRAGVRSGTPYDGPSQDPPLGNIPYYGAGLEFWFKPMFDATQQVTWGLCSVTQVKTPFKQEGIWTKGTQMFIFKNTDGVIRGTRLYFELAFDSRGKLHPELLNPNNIQDQRNYAPSGPIDPDKSIKYARTDAFIMATTPLIRNWKSNEWRHIAVRWDDRIDTGMASRFDIYVDGRKVSSAKSFGEKEGAFVTLNEKEPHDVMYVAGFERRQMYRAGVFKYPNPRDPNAPISEFCNGTMDGFRTFYSGPDFSTAGPPMRFYFAGKYENRVPVIFPPGAYETRIGSVSWTAYLPSDYGGFLKSQFTGGSVTVRIQVGSAAPQDLTNAEEIPNLTVTREVPVKYIVNLDAVQIPGLPNAVCSPVFDDITFTYVLPDAEVLESEEIFE
jgi:hypothetical protein